MVGLGVLAILVTLGIPVAIIVLVISVSGLKRRVAELEARVSALGLAERPGRAAVETSEAPVGPAKPGPGPWAAVAAEPGPAAESEPLDTPPPAPTPAPSPPPPAGPSVAERFTDWLRANWVYAVSALSLALAGVFFVQYGIENGLLTPPMRVAMAILLGLVLVTAGEVIRRRSGDEGGTSTAYLPSTFSGAGIVAIFAGILAARQLYGLIGPEAALVGLVLTAAGSVVIGWFYGPFLAAVGLTGASAAPFAVGGASANPEWLYGYFALVTLLGLAIDTMRRWAWVSALAVALGFLTGWLLFLAGTKPEWFAGYLTLLPLLAIAVPARGLRPDQSGPMLAETIWLQAGERREAREPGEDRAGPRPSFPTVLAGAAVAASSLSAVLLPGSSEAASLSALLAPAALAVILIVWTARAPALADLAVLPAAVFLVRIVTEPVNDGGLHQGFRAAALAVRAPETQAPPTVSVLFALGAALTVAAVWRGLRGTRHPAVWAAGAALTGPVAALLLELSWQPAQTMGAYPWALHVIALAAVMTGAGGLFARADGEDRRRAAYAGLAALSLIALALFLILAEAALTVALAVLLVAAAALDRRFRLPEMGWFAQAGVLVLGWRLTVDPGVGWAMAASWVQVVLAFAAAIVGMGAALRLFDGRDRKGAQVFLEGGIAAHAAIFANVVVTRLIQSRIGDGFVESYWSASLNAMPWLIVALVQVHRMQLPGRLMRVVRSGIAVAAGILAFAGIAAAVIPLNPLAAWGPEDRGALVFGPPVLDTLLVAYGVPGLLLIVASQRLAHLRRRQAQAVLGAGAALTALYAALEIRRFWRGDFLGVGGMTQPELYSYTVVLLVTGAALLYQAIARRSAGLRRIAMAVIALTIAKVFLIDASGLSGLTRVFSFLGLGLGLAGLAWLNRWAAGQQDDPEGAPSAG